MTTVKIALIDYVCDPRKPAISGLSDEVWDIARQLKKLNHDVHIIAPYLSDNYPNVGIAVHRFPLPPIAYRNIVGHVWILLRAVRVLRKMQSVDVVHNPEYVSTAIVSLLCPSIPVVFTEPGNIYERIQNGNGYDWITTQVYKLAAKISARRATYCIATSELMEWWWSRIGVKAGKIERIPLGVDVSLFQKRRTSEPVETFENGKLHIVYVARLSPENGPDVTLKAFSHLLRREPDSVLHMIGDGLEGDKLRKLSDSLSVSASVRWHGWVDLDVLPILYSVADVMVFSGYSGGTPRVLLQAMACETAVVAPAIGGIVDHVKDGETGLLFPAGDYIQMAAKIEALFQDPDNRKRIGQRASDYVNANLSWEVLARRLMTVYERAAGV